MYEFRLQCKDGDSRLLPLQPVRVFLSDGSTPATLFSLGEVPISNALTSDMSGIIEFRMILLVTLTFRKVLDSEGNLGPALPLFTAGSGVIERVPEGMEPIFVGENFPQGVEAPAILFKFVAGKLVDIIARERRTHHD